MDPSLASDPDQTLVSSPRAPTIGEAPAVGVRIGRYVVLSPIGAGAMGTVVAAYDPELDRKVAIKLLHARGSAHAASLRREAQTLAQLHHPNVVAVHDVGVVAGEHPSGETVFVAMEFVDGVTLRRWVADAPRTISEIVDTYVLAGRGLAGAHAAGIVHRDFKPDNVLVTRDNRGPNRVRVVDFGIAERSGVPSTTTDPDGDRDSSRSRTWGIVGTPAYMAPEQRLGPNVDARADQFSFCVALFEAIGGARPFDATLTLDRDAPDPPLPSSTPRPVPRWLRRVLARGLALDPRRRHATMTDLLDAIVRASPRRRARRFALVLATASVGVLGFVGARWSAPARCPEPEAELAGTWDAAARARVRAAFSASPLPFAATSSDTVIASVDAWADEWRASFADACASEPGSVHARELRLSCLASAKARMAAVVDLLETGEHDIIEEASRVVAGLRRETDCDDMRTIVREPPPPEDEALAAKVASLRARLDQVATLRVAQRSPAALELADALVAEVEQSGYAPLQAELALERARVQLVVGSFDEAETSAYEALGRAVAGGSDRTAYLATLALANVARYRERWYEARRWLALADAYLQRLGGSEGLELALHDIGFRIARDTRAYDEAEDHLARAQELREAIGQVDAESQAGEAGARAQLSHARGDIVATAAHLQEARALLGDSLGPAHPYTVAIEQSLAVIQFELGSLSVAISLARRAADARLRDLGPRSPTTLHAQSNLAVMLAATGDLDGAREFGEITVAGYAALSDSGQALAEARVNLAATELEAGRFARAHELLALARTDLERAKAPDSVLAVAHAVAAHLALAEGRYADVLLELDAWREKVGEHASPSQRLETEAWRALAHAGLGEHDTARTLAQSLALRLRDAPVAPWARARFRLDVAQALAPSDPVGARELASLAAADARSEGELARHTLARAESLLATLSR